MKNPFSSPTIFYYRKKIKFQSLRTKAVFTYFEINKKGVSESLNSDTPSYYSIIWT